MRSPRLPLDTGLAAPLHRAKPPCTYVFMNPGIANRDWDACRGSIVFKSQSPAQHQSFVHTRPHPHGAPTHGCERTRAGSRAQHTQNRPAKGAGSIVPHPPTTGDVEEGGRVWAKEALVPQPSHVTTPRLVPNAINGTQRGAEEHGHMKGASDSRWQLLSDRPRGEGGGAAAGRGRQDRGRQGSGQGAAGQGAGGRGAGRRRTASIGSAASTCAWVMPVSSVQNADSFG